MLNQCNKIKESVEKAIKIVSTALDIYEKQKDLYAYDRMLIVLQSLFRVQTDTLSLAMCICNSQREESLELRTQICKILEKRGCNFNEND